MSMTQLFSRRLRAVYTSACTTGEVDFCLMAQRQVLSITTTLGSRTRTGCAAGLPLRVGAHGALNGAHRAEHRWRPDETQCTMQTGDLLPLGRSQASGPTVGSAKEPSGCGFGRHARGTARVTQSETGDRATPFSWHAWVFGVSRTLGARAGRSLAELVLRGRQALRLAGAFFAAVARRPLRTAAAQDGRSAGQKTSNNEACTHMSSCPLDELRPISW